MVARRLLPLSALLTLVLVAPAPAAVRYGSGGPDRLRGTGGADALFGLGGNDRVLARGGADRAVGGNGNDTVDGSFGVDRIDGGPGNDTIAGGSAPDTVDCGPGTDTVFVNLASERRGRIRNCENVQTEPDIVSRPCGAGGTDNGETLLGTSGADTCSGGG